MKRLRRITFWMVPCLFAGLLASCGEEGVDWLDMTGDEYHPIPELIPFYEEDHQAIETGKSLDELDEVPRQVEYLRQFLTDPDGVETTAVINLDVHRITDFVALDDDRLFVLDSFTPFLIEHRLSTGESEIIAGPGGEPGDLLHAGRRMIRTGETLSVIAEDGMIRHYNCRTSPCEFDSAREVDFRPLAFAEREGLYAMLTSDLAEQELDGYTTALNLVDGEGEVIDTFGHAYDTGGHWMLEPALIENGSVHYMEGVDRYVLSYDYLPIIYTYDAETLELAETYRVEDFLLSRHGYNEEEQRVMIPMEEFSTVRTLPVDENLLLVESDTRLEMEPETEEEQEIALQVRWDRIYRYFLVDLRTGDSYHVGDRETPGVEYEQRLFVTSEGLALYDVQESTVQWLAAGE